MSRKSATRWLAFLSLVGFAFCLSGCGGSDPDSAAPAAAEGVTEAVQEPDIDRAEADRIAALSAMDLRAAMTGGELTAEQVTKAFLSRIARFDDAGPRLNAIIEVNPDALDIARSLDAALTAGRPPGPLHGVPVVVKANIDTADQMATSAGSLALAEHYAPEDAHIVQRLREAGAVLLGKANLSEWANFRDSDSISGWSSLGGQTRNPYRLSRNPCGSSSGSAVAVAARLAPLAVGTETNGSIVCPAGANGVLGLKPTMGRVSRHGIIPIAESQDIAGPMANTAGDLALLMSVLDGEDRRDRATMVRFKRYSILEPTVTDAKGMRIGVWRQYPGAGTNPELDALFDEQISRLKAAGAEIIDPVEMSTGDLGERSYGKMLYEFRSGLDRYLGGLPATTDAPRSLAELIAWNEAHADDALPLFGQDIFQAAQNIDMSELEFAEAKATVLREANVQLEGALQRHKLSHLISVTNGPAWPTAPQGDEFTVSSSTLAAISGHPHITVPMGLVDGLPVGMSVMVRRANEFRALKVAHLVEQLRDPFPEPTFQP